MRTVRTLAEARAFLEMIPRPLGLVPTMGYLHEGHLSLVRVARAANHSVAATIFVNPAQFGPNEDLSTYPRDMPRDLALLESEGVDVVFTPDVDEIYPPGGETMWCPLARSAASWRARRGPGTLTALQRW
jgi:pantoate--beta-alanine ligase